MQDRVILITGGATRIGRAIALALAAGGARVAIHYNGSEAAARATAKECDDAPVFQANMESTRGNVLPFRMGWREYFTRDLTPVRFIHIDAEHSYQEVLDNIATALPLIVDGGIICGDDSHHPPIQRAVTDTLGRVMVNGSLTFRRSWDRRRPPGRPR